jgi:kynurenine formamidase
MIYLSYLLDKNTPTYGNRNRFNIVKKSNISKGDVANDSSIDTTVHIGTHIDMPYHFYNNGQTIENFDANFWIFSKILFLDIEPNNLIIKDELINKLDTIKDIGYEILIVKTSICDIREREEFWEKNYGFSPDIAEYLRENFPNIRVFGFDSISVSSFQNRLVGRVAHKRFLDPKKPILLLEDMDLREVNCKTKFKQIVISPLRVAKCDGLPCTIFGEIYD